MVKLWIKVKEEDKILNDTVLENEADLTEDVFLDMMSKAADVLDKIKTLRSRCNPIGLTKNSDLAS